MLQEGMEILSEGLQTFAGETVVYTRENQANDSLRVTFGKSTFEVVGSDGCLLEVVTDDALLDTADLTLGGQQIFPKRYDRIPRTLPSGEVVTYEVFPPDKNRQCYILSCQDLRMRIHCKRVA